MNLKLSSDHSLPLTLILRTVWQNFPEDNISSFYKQRTISSPGEQAQGFWLICVLLEGFSVVLLLWATSCLPGCSEEKCHDRNFHSLFFTTVLRCSEDAWQSWIWMNKNSTKGKNNLQQWQPCERVPLPADLHGSHQAGGSVSDRAINEQILLKTSKFDLKCWAEIIEDRVSPHSGYGGTAKLPIQN